MQSKQAIDARRAVNRPWRAWYGTARWKRLRAYVLANEPVCRMCKAARSTVCDHVTLHNGDPLKFWGGPFQALCAPCHNSTKQAMEALTRSRKKGPIIGADGWPIETPKPAGYVERDELYWPKDLKPSKPSLTIVAGAPASGKTAFVKQNAKPGDVIIDSDLEARRLGLNPFAESWGDRVRIIKARNDRLRELAASNAERAWFMGLLARPEDREHFASLLKPAEIVVIVTPADECVRRIKATRADATNALFQAVNRWHRTYKARPGEKVMRCTEIR